MTIGLAENAQRRIVVLFPGQGTQKKGMGLNLSKTEPEFAGALHDCARILSGFGIDLEAILAGTAEVGLDATAMAQPAIFAFEWALAAMWASKGVLPDVMIGHSLGGIVAAARANVMSLGDALSVVVARGRLMERAPPGAMIAVYAGASEVEPYLGKECVIASTGSPVNCAASGPTSAIAELEARLSAIGIHTRRLRAAKAFHSPSMRDLVPELEREFGSIRLNPPSTTVVSSVTVLVMTAEEAVAPHYWADQIATPVRFLDSLRTVGTTPNTIWLELGPAALLGELVRATFGQDVTTIASVSESHPTEADSVAAAQFALYRAGVSANFNTIRVPANEPSIVQPRTPTEHKLARLWSATLGLGAVGIRDDFFELGGNSLQAIEVVAEVNELFDGNFDLETLFNARTIEELGARIDNNRQPA
jgi:acyl transferase domain-containing protein